MPRARTCLFLAALLISYAGGRTAVARDSGPRAGAGEREPLHWRADLVIDGQQTDTGHFVRPYLIRADREGNVCVTDSFRVQKFTPEGRLLWALHIDGYAGGTFGCEEGADGSLWVSDYLGAQLLHYAPATSGQALLERIDTSDLRGLGLVRPFALAFGREGRLYMTSYADPGTGGIPRIVVYDTHRHSWEEFWRSDSTLTQLDVSEDGERIAVVGSFASRVTVLDSRAHVLATTPPDLDALQAPQGVAWVDAREPELWVSSEANCACVQLYDGVGPGDALRKTVTLGSRGAGTCEFLAPRFIARDRHGRVFVSDEDANRVTRWVPDETGCP